MKGDVWGCSVLLDSHIWLSIWRPTADHFSTGNLGNRWVSLEQPGHTGPSIFCSVQLKHCTALLPPALHTGQFRAALAEKQTRKQPESQLGPLYLSLAVGMKVAFVSPLPGTGYTSSSVPAQGVGSQGQEGDTKRMKAPPTCCLCLPTWVREGVLALQILLSPPAIHEERQVRQVPLVTVLPWASRTAL